MYGNGIKWLHTLQKNRWPHSLAQVLIVQLCLDLRDDTGAIPSCQAPYYPTVELVKPFLFGLFFILSFLLDADVHDETWNLQSVGCWKTLCNNQHQVPVSIPCLLQIPVSAGTRIDLEARCLHRPAHAVFYPESMGRRPSFGLSTSAMIDIDWIWSRREIQTSMYSSRASDTRARANEEDGGEEGLLKEANEIYTYTQYREFSLFTTTELQNIFDPQILSTHGVTT